MTAGQFLGVLFCRNAETCWRSISFAHDCHCRRCNTAKLFGKRNVQVLYFFRSQERSWVCESYVVHYLKLKGAQQKCKSALVASNRFMTCSYLCTEVKRKSIEVNLHQMHKQCLFQKGQEQLSRHKLPEKAQARSTSHARSHLVVS